MTDTATLKLDDNGYVVGIQVGDVVGQLVIAADTFSIQDGIVKMAGPIGPITVQLDGFQAHPDMIGDIAAFHERFGQAYDGPPRLLPDDLHDFRVKFHGEETSEYSDERLKLVNAADQSDDEAVVTGLHKQIDALVDAAYVVLGTAYLQFGAERFAEAWRRAHGKNMLKVRKDRAEDGHTDSGRAAKYDIVKPAGWTEPDHRDLMVGWIDER